MGKQRPEERVCDSVGCCGGWTDRPSDVRIISILYTVITLALDLRHEKSPPGLFRTPPMVYSDGGLVSCHDSASATPGQFGGT